MIDDPEIQEIRTKQRQATMKKVGIAAVVIIAATVAVIPTGGSVASMLAEKGHTDVEIERKGVFSFGFRSVQGEATCSGTVTKMPGSVRQSQMCRSVSGGLEMSETDPDGRKTGIVTP